jgi:hypothetical protein
MTAASGAWLFGLSVAGHASAQTEAQPEVVTASLELLTTPGCGTEAELARAIRARSERIRIESETTASRRLRIEVHESVGGVTTVLSLTQPNGRRSTRTLRASNCAEALDGAALVAAVSLDPAASTATVVEAPAPPPPAPPPPPACPVCAPPAPPPPAETPHLAWTALVAFDAISGPAPAIMPGFGLTAMLAHERKGVLSPAVRLSFSHFARGDFAAEGGRADFALDTGSLELCPLRAAAGPLRLYPCVLRVTAGALQASGSSTIEPASRRRPWWELGSSLVALLRPSRSLELTLSCAAGWPLVRDHFQFEPLEFHRVSGLALTLGAGAGVTFQ